MSVGGKAQSARGRKRFIAAAAHARGETGGRDAARAPVWLGRGRTRVKEVAGPLLRLAGDRRHDARHAVRCEDGVRGGGEGGRLRLASVLLARRARGCLRVLECSPPSRSTKKWRCGRLGRGEPARTTAGWRRQDLFRLVLSRLPAILSARSQPVGTALSAYASLPAEEGHLLGARTFFPSSPRGDGAKGRIVSA